MYIGGDSMTTTNITNFRKNVFSYEEEKTIKILSLWTYYER